MKEKPDIDTLRLHKKRLENARDRLEKVEQQKESELGRKHSFWTIYNSGAKETDELRPGYFSVDRGDSFAALVSQEEAEKHIADMRERYRKPVLALDVMGQGIIGTELKADHSLGWTFAEQGGPKVPGQELAYGDLLDTMDRKRLFEDLDQRLEENNAQLSDVFFRAIGGFGQYIQNDYALAALYEEVLKPLYARAPIGAFFYLQIDYPPRPNFVMDTLKENGFSVLGPKRGCYVLIKTEESDTLPSLRKIFKDNPERFKAVLQGGL